MDSVPQLEHDMIDTLPLVDGMSASHFSYLWITCLLEFAVMSNVARNVLVSTCI